MQLNISKLCADFLRQITLAETGMKLKATHSRELIAAMFGYKSHAGLLAEEEFLLDDLPDADILIPNVILMDKRRKKLEDLPSELPISKQLAKQISDFLKEERIFVGDVWLPYDTLENHLIEEILPEHNLSILDDLSGPMAETNAIFDEVNYEDVNLTEEEGKIIFSINGTVEGTTDVDKPFSGETINFTATVEMGRVAGKIAYRSMDIEVGGSVNWDWADHEGIPN